MDVEQGTEQGRAGYGKSLERHVAAPMGLVVLRQGLRSQDSQVLRKRRGLLFPGLIRDATVDVGIGRGRNNFGAATAPGSALCVRYYLLNKLTRLAKLGIMALPDQEVWPALLARAVSDKQRWGIRRTGRGSWTISS